jgi:DNA-binding MarR family transcriptional regulator
MQSVTWYPIHSNRHGSNVAVRPTQTACCRGPWAYRSALGNCRSPPSYVLDLRTPLKRISRKAQAAAPFAYDGLDRVIHERARLGVLTSLLTHPTGLPFAEMKTLCALTDGNLNRHLQVLQEASLVSLGKGPARNRPQTFYRITAMGRKRYLDYLAVLEQVILDGASATNIPLPERSA